jgi:hypothetical protein
VGWGKMVSQLGLHDQDLAQDTHAELVKGECESGKMVNYLGLHDQDLAQDTHAELVRGECELGKG